MREALKMLNWREEKFPRGDTNPITGYKKIVRIFSVEGVYYSFERMKERVDSRAKQIREIGGCTA